MRVKARKLDILYMQYGKAWFLRITNYHIYAKCVTIYMYRYTKNYEYKIRQGGRSQRDEHTILSISLITAETERKHDTICSNAM